MLDTVLNLYNRNPKLCPGGLAVSLSDSWHGGRDFDLQLRQISFKRIFTTHLWRSTREKKSVALERKVVLVLVWESHMCVTECHDMTLAVKVASEPVQPTNQKSRFLKTLRRETLGNIFGKGENAGNHHFLLSHNVFYPFQNKFSFSLTLLYFVICKCFQFWPIHKFVIWKNVRMCD